MITEGYEMRRHFWARPFRLVILTQLRSATMVRDTGDMVSWLFRNRSTGHITLAQTPNWSLIAFALLTAIRWTFASAGAVGTVLVLAADAALAFWSIDELVRGVNPFRRALGAGVLVWTRVSTVRAIL